MESGRGGKWGCVSWDKMIQCLNVYENIRINSILVPFLSAIFLSVARGKVAEGVDFDRHYGRCGINLCTAFITFINSLSHLFTVVY